MGFLFVKQNDAFFRSFFDKPIMLITMIQFVSEIISNIGMDCKDEKGVQIWLKTAQVSSEGARDGEK